MKMENILKAKGARVITAPPHTKVTTIAYRMKLERIGAVVISDDGKAFLGIITERDILSGLVDHGADLFDMRAADLMSRESPTCTGKDNIKHVMDPPGPRERARDYIIGNHREPPLNADSSHGARSRST